MENAVRMNGSLVISTVVTMAEGMDAGRYRLLAKLQLTEPGKGRHPGLLRNYLADANCDAAQIRVTVPEYTEQVGFELEQIQAYARFVLLDCVTGYRSQYQEGACVISVR